MAEGMVLELMKMATAAVQAVARVEANVSNLSTSMTKYEENMKAIDKLEKELAELKGSFKMMLKYLQEVNKDAKIPDFNKIPDINLVVNADTNVTADKIDKVQQGDG